MGRKRNVSGTWTTNVTNPSGNRQEMTLNIRQRGQKIHGILYGGMIVIKHDPKKNITETKEFVIKGQCYKDRFVILNAYNAIREATGIATYLFEIIGGADKMKGIGTWYSITNKEISSMEYVWNRKCT